MITCMKRTVSPWTRNLLGQKWGPQDRITDCNLLSHSLILLYVLGKAWLGLAEMRAVWRVSNSKVSLHPTPTDPSWYGWTLKSIPRVHLSPDISKQKCVPMLSPLYLVHRTYRLKQLISQLDYTPNHTKGYGWLKKKKTIKNIFEAASANLPS